MRVQSVCPWAFVRFQEGARFIQAPSSKNSRKKKGIEEKVCKVQKNLRTFTHLILSDAVWDARFHQPETFKYFTSYCLVESSVLYFYIFYAILGS